MKAKCLPRWGTLGENLTGVSACDRLRVHLRVPDVEKFVNRCSLDFISSLLHKALGRSSFCQSLPVVFLTFTHSPPRCLPPPVAVSRLPSSVSLFFFCSFSPCCITFRRLGLGTLCSSACSGIFLLCMARILSQAAFMLPSRASACTCLWTDGYTHREFSSFHFGWGAFSGRPFSSCVCM